MAERNYDPEFDELLPLLPTVSDFSTVEKIREARAMRAEMLGDIPDRDDVAMDDRLVPGPEGAPQVPIRIYTPKAGGDALRPAVFEIHGGGFLLGSIDMMDPWCQNVAARLGAVVVSVEYRLAPEDPFPAGLEDCYAALCWTADQAAAIGIDAERIAIAGQSAGGGLAAATALLARDRGGPQLCFQLLEIPELDDRLDTPSMRAFTDTPLWNRPNAIVSWRYYLADALGGDVSIYAAPARAEDLSGLPPAYVSTMEYDPLRDEGIRYAMRLLEHGVSVELHSFPGTFHGSAMMANAEVSKRSSIEMTNALRRGLAGKD